MKLPVLHRYLGVLHLGVLQGHGGGGVGVAAAVLRQVGGFFFFLGGGVFCAADAASPFLLPNLPLLASSSPFPPRAF